MPSSNWLSTVMNPKWTMIGLYPFYGWSLKKKKLPPWEQNFKQYIHGLLWLKKHGLMGSCYKFSQTDRDLKEERLEYWWQGRLGRDMCVKWVYWNEPRGWLLCSAKDFHRWRYDDLLSMSTNLPPQPPLCLLTGTMNKVQSSRNLAPWHELPLTNNDLMTTPAGCQLAGSSYQLWASDSEPVSTNLIADWTCWAHLWCRGQSFLSIKRNINSGLGFATFICTTHLAYRNTVHRCTKLSFKLLCYITQHHNWGFHLIEVAKPTEFSD